MRWMCAVILKDKQSRRVDITRRFKDNSTEEWLRKRRPRRFGHVVRKRDESVKKVTNLVFEGKTPGRMLSVETCSSCG